MAFELRFERCKVVRASLVRGRTCAKARGKIETLRKLKVGFMQGALYGKGKSRRKNWECEQGSMHYLAVYQKFGFHCLKSKLGPLKMFLFMNFGVLLLGAYAFVFVSFS